MKKVIDTETKKKFRLVNIDFKENKAVIHNKNYGYCTQEIDKLRLPFLHRKLTPPVPLIKKFRIALVISTAFFLLWFVELLVFTVTAQPDLHDKLPQFLAWQFFTLMVVWVVIGIMSAIKWRKDIGKAIRDFINNK